jgi:class 3 adenylate cyclase
LFTDLHGSTALYERVGDAAACRIVRRHFALLADIVRDHDGAVVKTIGDAVMAAFINPADAVKAALAIQARIADLSLVHARGTDRRPLAIKLGVHSGGSVRVRLNNQLDYFGSAVNMAAHLRAQSANGDVVLSRVVAEHPAVRPLLAATPIRTECVSLKGFDGPVGFVRVPPAGRDPPQERSPAPTCMGTSVGTYQICLALVGQ